MKRLIAPEFAATDENFKNSNWITDGDYDACSAAQKVLDAYEKFGEVFSRDCHWNKQTEEKEKLKINKYYVIIGDFAAKFGVKNETLKFLIGSEDIISLI